MGMDGTGCHAARNEDADDETEQRFEGLLVRGTTTDAELARRGYDISPMCTECGMADTVQHRLYVACDKCQTYRDKAGAKLQPSILKEGRAKSDSSLYCRGLVPDPSYKVKTKAPDQILIKLLENGEEKQGITFKSGKRKVYLGGSAFDVQFNALTRSGAAIARRTEEDGWRIAEVTVPRGARLDAPYAEHLAPLVASQLGEDGLHIVADCAAVRNC